MRRSQYEQMFSAVPPTADMLGGRAVQLRGDAARARPPFHNDHSANKQSHRIPRRLWNLRGPLLRKKPNVHRGWLYFRKVASPEVSLIYRSLRRRILPRQSISAL
jgi:hypothetical protein